MSPDAAALRDPRGSARPSRTAAAVRTLTSPPARRSSVGCGWDGSGRTNVTSPRQVSVPDWGRPVRRPRVAVVLELRVHERRPVARPTLGARRRAVAPTVRRLGRRRRVRPDGGGRRVCYGGMARKAHATWPGVLPGPPRLASPSPSGGTDRPARVLAGSRRTVGRGRGARRRRTAVPRQPRQRAPRGRSSWPGCGGARAARSAGPTCRRRATVLVGWLTEPVIGPYPPDCGRRNATKMMPAANSSAEASPCRLR